MAELFSQVNQNHAGGYENLRGSVKVQKKYATEDLVVAVIANERRKGKAYGVEKIKADLASLNLDPGNAEEVSRRSDEVLEEINRSLKREIDENTVNDRSYIQAATDKAQKKRIIGMSERIGMKAYQKGRYDEREAQKLANQKESIAAQILASAQGFGADAMESRYGFDIIDTVANAEDGRKKKEKEPEQAEEETEEAVGVPLDKVNPEPAEVPEPEEVPAEKSEMMAGIIERAKNRSDEIEARYQEDEEEGKGESAQEKDDSKPEAGNSGEGEKAGGEVPAEPIPVIKRERLDFKRPSDFLAFVEEIVEAELRENGKIRDGESPWASPVNRRELLNTARRWLQKLAYALCYSYRREIVLKDIDDLKNAKSIEGIECGIMNTYEMLQERMIKESRDKLVSKLEKDGNKIAKQGRLFSRNTEETERKVRAEVEYWWRNIKRYFRMNASQIEEETKRLDEIISKRENDAGEDSGYDILNDRDWTRANDLKAALTQYGGLYYLRPAQIEEISRDILSRLERSKWELEDKRIEDRLKANVIANRLRKAMANPKAEREKKIPEQGLLSRFTDSMIGIFSLRIRNLIRYSRGEERRNAERTIQSIEDS
ncbi:MAG: hypothetical protein SPK06_03620, partial [Kiritimatiellia bacterium]|nr:hypothetical protein [Kiritimatiellia bacterium]